MEEDIVSEDIVGDYDIKGAPDQRQPMEDPLTVVKEILQVSENPAALTSSERHLAHSPSNKMPQSPAKKKKPSPRCASFF